MDVRYPIGKFSWSGTQTDEERNRCIAEIAATPSRMRKAVAGLSVAWSPPRRAYHVIT